MTRRKLLAAATLPLVFSATEGAETGEISKWKSETWLRMVSPAFTMAYEMGDFEEVDKQPSAPEDPFFKAGEEKLPSPRLISEEAASLHVATIIARTKKRARVSKGQLEALMSALLDSHVNMEERIKDCYDPKHLIVCYSSWGHVLGAVEICFSCDQFRLFPGGPLVRTLQYDLVTVAKIMDELGLSLGGNKSFAEYKQDYVEWTEKRAREKAKVRDGEKKKQ